MFEDRESKCRSVTMRSCDRVDLSIASSDCASEAIGRVDFFVTGDERCGARGGVAFATVLPTQAMHTLGADLHPAAIPPTAAC